MTGGICYRAGYEKGAWYELKCLRDTITKIESIGGDATFERKLYKAWLKIPEYAKADKENRAKGFYSESASVRNKRESAEKTKSDVNHSPPIYATSKETVKRGRPPKKGEVHRTTEWRRRKNELQGVLI